MSLEAKPFYTFGQFRLDPVEKVLTRDDRTISLTPKVFDTLFFLVQNAGRTVEKDELISSVWSERFVQENNLTFNIKMLRKALEDSATEPQYIETVPKRGYRFIAKVEKVTGGSAPPVTQETVGGGVVTKPKRGYVALAATATIFVIGMIALGAWYGKFLSTGPPILNNSFSAEKLTTSGKTIVSSISPDGKTIVYSSETGGKQALWLRQLDSGENIEIVPPTNNIYFSLEFSPNGDFIYFGRLPADEGSFGDIYRISIFGGVPVKIAGDTMGLLSLSDDGKTIAYFRCKPRNPGTCSIFTADAADGQNERLLRTSEPPTRIGQVQISPDGRYLAFAAGQSENQSSDFGLYQIDLQTGAERELSPERFFDIKSLTWLPAGDGLLIAASRMPNRKFRIWHVAPNGKAEPLTKNSDDYSLLDLDRSASLLAAVQIKPEFNLSVYSIAEPANKKVIGDAYVGAISPGGRIFFSSTMTNNEEIWSIEPDGSARKQLTNDPADDSGPVPSPDGRHIYFSSNRTGSVHVWRMNPDGSNPVQITRSHGGFPISLTADGKWVFVHHGTDRTLWRASTDGSGIEEKMLDTPRYRFAISPGGDQAAYVEREGTQRKLTIVSLAGEKVRSFPTPVADTRISEVDWMPDGKSIAYILGNSLMENGALWIQPLDGSPARQVTSFEGKEIPSMAISPDGRSFSIVQGEWKSDAVLIHGLK